MLSFKANNQTALKQLNLLTLNPNKRRRILRGAGRKVRRDSKARLKEQRDLSGRTWQARSNGRKKRMLSKLGRNIQVHTSTNDAKVTFGNQRVGQIARAHQDGISQRMTSSKAAQMYGTPNYDDGATRKQAKALRDAGYKVRKKRGKGWKTPTLKWITENLTIGKAGLVLRILRGNKKGKSSWEIKLAQRSFLGQNQSESKQLTNYMLDEAMRLS